MCVWQSLISTMHINNVACYRDCVRCFALLASMSESGRVHNGADGQKSKLLVCFPPPLLLLAFCTYLSPLSELPSLIPIPSHPLVVRPVLERTPHDNRICANKASVRKEG